MASVVGIVNVALGKLGETKISSLGDAVKGARVANDEFEEKRDFVLDEHHWNFAKARAQLAAASTAPIWGFTNSFPLPTACIHPILVNGEDEFSNRWKVEGRAIVTDLDAPLELLYVQRISDPNVMSPRFRALLATYCAWQWCEQITGSDQKKADLEAEYYRELSTARSKDSQEGTTEQLVSNRWEEARFGGGTIRDDVEFSYDPGTY